LLPPKAEHRRSVSRTRRQHQVHRTPREIKRANRESGEGLWSRICPSRATGVLPRQTVGAPQYIYISFLRVAACLLGWGDPLVRKYMIMAAPGACWIANMELRCGHKVFHTPSRLEAARRLVAPGVQESFDSHATHACTLQPAALAFVSYGFVLV